mgnify:CR=1 FL=1
MESLRTRKAFRTAIQPIIPFRISGGSLTAAKAELGQTFQTTTIQIHFFTTPCRATSENALVVTIEWKHEGKEQEPLYSNALKVQNRLDLGRLSEKHGKLSVGSCVTPNSTIGYTGNTGHCWGQGYDMQGEINKDKRLLGYGAHLHLHVYLSPKDVADFLDLIITGEGENQIIYATKKKDTFVVNPFARRLLFWRNCFTI